MYLRSKFAAPEKQDHIQISLQVLQLSIPSLGGSKFWEVLFVYKHSII